MRSESATATSISASVSMLAVQSPESANDANATSVMAAARSPPNRQTRSVPATVVPTHVSQRGAR